MGERGTGSLEPGVASGDVFVIAYPSPFLDYYYVANPTELPIHMQVQDRAADHAEVVVDEDGNAGAEAGDSVEKEAPMVFQYLSLLSDTLMVAGPRRGCRALRYSCNISNCNSTTTLYARGADTRPGTSNAFKHIRDRAIKCTGHRQVLA